jgi:hypothetical protein
MAKKKKTRHIRSTPSYKPAIRPLLFGDFKDGCLVIAPHEAAILVIDEQKAALSKIDPSINPFVSAWIGDPRMIEREKAKYEGNPRYFLQFFPAVE